MCCAPVTERELAKGHVVDRRDTDTAWTWKSPLSEAQKDLGRCRDLEISICVAGKAVFVGEIT